MSKWKQLLATLAIAGASGAVIASDAPLAEASYESAPAASERHQAQTSAERTEGQDTKAIESEGGAS